MEEVELTHANPTYAHIRYKDGRESSLSLKDLAPSPRNTLSAENATVGNDAKLFHEGNVAELGQSDTVPTPIIENADGDLAEPVQQLRLKILDCARSLKDTGFKMMSDFLHRGRMW